MEEIGRSFSPGAVEALVDDLRTVRLGTDFKRTVKIQASVEPLLLQVACASFFDSLAPGHQVISKDDVAGVDRWIAGFCRRMIEEVADDHFHGDASELRTRLLESFVDPQGLPEIVKRGATETGGLPNQVIEALMARRILRTAADEIGGPCRIWHERLVLPLVRGGAVEQGTRSAADEFQLAQWALRAGRFDVAIRRAGQALRTAGENGRLRAEIESFLGDVAYLSEDLDGAIVHYRRAAQLLAAGPGTGVLVATLLTAVGRILIRQGEFDEAIKELHAAGRRSPDDSAIQTDLAWAMWYSGRENGAVDVLDSALELEGNAPEALRARGEIMSDLQQPDRAIRDLERVRPLHRSSTKAAYALALALRGDVSEAVLTIPPIDSEQSSATLLRVARVLEVAGELSEAAQLAQRARQATGRPLLPPRLAAEADRLSRRRD
nr:tetratricopeptide repeat protein [Planotetraspora silvatica]